MDESPLFSKTHDLLLWLIPHAHSFPRVHRFGLAQRLEQTAMDFQDDLIAAGKNRGTTRREYLHQADIRLARLRAWIRLARDLKVLSIRQYEHAARQLAEVGRLLGAWIKQSKR